MLPSPDVIMEWDLLVLPTLRGSKVIVLMIVNFTESTAQQTFEVVMHTSEIDKWAQAGLALLKQKHDKPEG